MKTTRLIAWVLLLTGPLVAAVEAVGQVSSAGPVTLSGTPMDAVGVISWTVLNGDEITTGDVSALILLRNGGRLVLAAKSKVAIRESKVILLGGRAFVGCRHDCHITVNARDRSVSLGRGDQVSVVVADGTVAITTGVTAPAFEMPAEKLLQRLPYTMGLHLPKAQK